MKILHIILGKANPDRMNGVNKFVYNLASEQMKTGLNVEVWGITPEPEEPGHTPPFPLRLFKASKRPFGTPRTLLDALDAQPSSETCLHFHGGWIPDFGLVSIWLKAYNFRYILTPHGAYNQVAMQRSRFRKWCYYHLLERGLIENAAAVHSLGESERAGLSTLTHKANQVLIPPGFKNEASTDTGKKDIAFTVSWCGRIDAHTKGLDILLHALYLANQDGIPVRARLIGDGEDRQKVEQLVARYKLENQVELCGSQFGADKDRLLQQSHAFVHPSRNEGMPTSVLEAAALGLPCLVSRETNMARYVQEYGAGWVPGQNTAENWVGILKQAYQAHVEGDLLKYGRQAQQLVEQEFSWQVVVRRLDVVYRKAMGVQKIAMAQ